MSFTLNIDSLARFLYGLFRWIVILGAVVVAFVLGSRVVGLAWTQSSGASANLAFDGNDVKTIEGVAQLARSTGNEALIVHTVNAMISLKGSTNYRALGLLSIGAGLAFLATGVALFLIGAEGALRVQLDTRSAQRIALYAAAPGFLCFILSAMLIALGVTRKYDMQLKDYQSNDAPKNIKVDPRKSGCAANPKPPVAASAPKPPVAASAPSPCPETT